jgi:DNA polymerase III delta subunit
MYLLHGENVYQSWQELLKLRAEYTKKDPSYEFIIMDSDEIDLSKLDMSGYSMFSKKYFYVFKRFFSLSKELREKIWKEIINLQIKDVIFWEDGNADKRSKVYKEMIKVGTVREFTLLKEREMYNKIQKELIKRNIKTSNDFVHEILFRYGSNEFIVESELNKLQAYLEVKKRNEVRTADIEILSEGMVQDNWKFIELFFSKNKKEAIDYLRNANIEIDSQKMLLGGISSTLRNVYLNQIYSKDKLSYISGKLGIHPFVLSKSASYARNFSTQRLEKLYEQLANFDYSLNLGRIDFKLGMILLIMSL